MSKTHTTLTLDTEIVNKCKSLGMNISGEVNQFLNNRCNSQDQDLGQINIRLIDIKLEKKAQLLAKTQAEIAKLQQIKEKYQENIKKMEEEQLKKEKERLDKQQRCTACGLIVPDKIKMHKFPCGLVCNTCFMAGNNKEAWYKETVKSK